MQVSAEWQSIYTIKLNDNEISALYNVLATVDLGEPVCGNTAADTTFLAQLYMQINRITAAIEATTPCNPMDNITKHS